MQPFVWPVVGELWLAALIRPLFVALMRWQGVKDRSVPAVELAAYVDLLKRGDGGRAFLRIMRGFELTTAKRELYESVVRNVPYPVQVVWGADDPALRLAMYGRQAARAAGVDSVHTVPAKHFLLEDQPAAVADRVAALAARG
jgi:pimeloyl-ACP methyl ester carboxylesterase